MKGVNKDTTIVTHNKKIIDKSIKNNITIAQLYICIKFFFILIFFYSNLFSLTHLTAMYLTPFSIGNPACADLLLTTPFI